METVAISKFKATCLAVLEQVRRTGEPVLVTRRGEPVAQVVPPWAPTRRASWLGAMAGTGRLELPHQDPADRFLAATALVHDLTLVAEDERLVLAEGFRVLPNR